MKTILVTGGAGYIGSFMTKRLLDEEYKVIVTDSLERGHEKAIDKRASFIRGDISDRKFLSDIFTKYKFDGIIHFAGYISMSESVENPAIYFQNNVQTALILIEEMRRYNVDRFIFSSTAGVYGNPERIPIDEDHLKKPTNPYGESKLMVEKILEWYNRIFGFSYVALRYFNASGAALDGSMGENHNPETHIIPNIIRAIINETEFELFGNDYDTKDGTCIRDYIHVLDLVDAHVFALEKLERGNGAYAYNVGTGNGYSNKDVLNMVQEVTGKKVKVKVSPRRAGDASELVADSSKIQKELGFKPQYSDLQTIIQSAWKWHTNNSK